MDQLIPHDQAPDASELLKQQANTLDDVLEALRSEGTGGGHDEIKQLEEELAEARLDAETMEASLKETTVQLVKLRKAMAAVQMRLDTAEQEKLALERTLLLSSTMSLARDPSMLSWKSLASGGPSLEPQRASQSRPVRLITALATSRLWKAALCALMIVVLVHTSRSGHDSLDMPPSESASSTWIARITPSNTAAAGVVVAIALVTLTSSLADIAGNTIKETPAVGLSASTVGVTLAAAWACIAGLVYFTTINLLGPVEDRLMQLKTAAMVSAAVCGLTFRFSVRSYHLATQDAARLLADAGASEDSSLGPALSRLAWLCFTFITRCALVLHSAFLGLVGLRGPEFVLALLLRRALSSSSSHHQFELASTYDARLCVVCVIAVAVQLAAKWMHWTRQVMIVLHRQSQMLPVNAVSQSHASVPNGDKAEMSLQSATELRHLQSRYAACRQNQRVVIEAVAKWVAAHLLVTVLVMTALHIQSGSSPSAVAQSAQLPLLLSPACAALAAAFLDIG
jgi:hypothetical protein